MSSIREATPADIPTILALVRELATYERMPDQATATEAQFSEALFGEAHVAYCVLAEDAGEVAGFALYFLNFSTWSGRPGIYLEDLYVREHTRGQGHGKALMTHLARLCKERGYARFEWSVLDWNEPSLSFYRSLGAVALDSWTTYRLSGDALRELAS